MISWWMGRRAQRIEDAMPVVLAAILAEPNARHYGYAMWKQLGLRPCYLYPALHALLEAGLITDGWEDDPGDRPPRRYYRAPSPGQGQA